MQTQLNFLDVKTDTDKPIPTQEAVQTSRESRDILNKHKNKYRQKIYNFIKEQNGATCDHIEVELGMLHSTVSGIITFLKIDRLVKDSGERRKTRSGRRAILWVTI